MDSKENATRQPIILDVGKQKKKRIKQLKKGEGDLIEDVRQAAEQVRRRLGNAADVVPVVIVFDYAKKRSKKRAIPMFAPLPFL